MFNLFKGGPRKCDSCGTTNENVEKEPYYGSFAFFCEECRAKRKKVEDLSKPINEAYKILQERFPKAMEDELSNDQIFKPFWYLSMGYRNGKEEDANFKISWKKRDNKPFLIEPLILQAIIKLKNDNTRFVINNDEGILICNKYLNNKFIKKYELTNSKDVVRFIKTQVHSFSYENFS